MASDSFAKLCEAFKKNPLTVRLGLNGLRSEFNNMSIGFKCSDETVFEIVDADGVKVEWVDVMDSILSRVIIYLHGGGYIMGTNEMYHHFAERLAQSTRARILLIDYRLAPENIFPSALNDVITVYKWLLKKSYSPNEIFFAGDGAGAGLMLSSFLKFRSLGIKMPSASACISPLTDLSLTAKSISLKSKVDPILTYELLKFCADNYVGDEGDRCNPFVSPFFGDLSGLPPLLTMVGENEILFDDALRFSKKAEFFGVDSTLVIAHGMIHNWSFFAPILNEGQQVIDYIGKYFAKYFNGSEET